LEDEDVSKEIEKQFGRMKIKMKTGTKVEKIDD
jgi:pyruvate/2-oxoglutarate dehydrogenase complex dihydrolipoamide dehydrogenase (E3) component